MPSLYTLSMCLGIKCQVMAGDREEHAQGKHHTGSQVYCFLENCIYASLSFLSLPKMHKNQTKASTGLLFSSLFRSHTQPLICCRRFLSFFFPLWHASLPCDLLHLCLFLPHSFSLVFNFSFPFLHHSPTPHLSSIYSHLCLLQSSLPLPSVLLLHFSAGQPERLAFL